MVLVRRMASTGAPKLAEAMIRLITASDEIQIKGSSMLILGQVVYALVQQEKANDV